MSTNLAAGPRTAIPHDGATARPGARARLGGRDPVSPLAGAAWKAATVAREPRQPPDGPAGAAGPARPSSSPARSPAHRWPLRLSRPGRWRWAADAPPIRRCGYVSGPGARRRHASRSARPGSVCCLHGNRGPSLRYPGRRRATTRLPLRRGLDGADRALIEELTDLIGARTIATPNQAGDAPAGLADLAILVGKDKIYAPPVRQLRLLGIPTWLIVPGRLPAVSVVRAACAVSVIGPCPGIAELRISRSRRPVTGPTWPSLPGYLPSDLPGQLAAGAGV